MCHFKMHHIQPTDLCAIACICVTVCVIVYLNVKFPNKL